MVGLYGISNYSSLFNTSSSGSGSNAMSSFYSNLSQYASVRSGTYLKATKAYYAKMAKESNTTTESQKKTDTTSYNQNVISATNKTSVALNNVKTKAAQFVDSAQKLTDTGKNSLFADKDKYDKDATYKAVSSFIDDYNDTVSALNSTTNSSVKIAGNSMTRMTDVMSNSLSKVGVTVGKDGKLSVDEETFKNADMDKVKTLFNGSGSYASIVSASASRVVSQATNQINGLNGNLYGSSGSYNNYFTSGIAYNGFF